MRATTLAVVALAFAAPILSGCFDAEFTVKVANATNQDLLIHVWVNGSVSKFQSNDLVRAGDAIDAGVFKPRAGSDYRIDVVASSGITNSTPRFLHLANKEIGPTYGDLRLVVTEKGIDVYQGARQLN